MYKFKKEIVKISLQMAWRLHLVIMKETELKCHSILFQYNKSFSYPIHTYQTFKMFKVV